MAWVLEEHLYFNPHSHEGSDFLHLFFLSFSLDFNPHSHEGSDKGMHDAGAITTISIHTPTKGVTRLERS